MNAESAQRAVAVATTMLSVLVLPAPPVRPAERAMRWAAPGWRLPRVASDAVAMDEGAGPQLPVPVLLDLVAAALDAGLPTANAVREAFAATGVAVPPPVRAAVQSMDRGAAVDRAWAAAPADYWPLVRALRLAERSGAAIGPLIRATAADDRADRARAAHIAARRLGVQLVLPLGLTTLPSFLLLGVLPIVVGFAEPVLRGG
jgi:hypothetical protein